MPGDDRAYMAAHTTDRCLRGSLAAMSTTELAASVEHLSKRFRVVHERHQSLKQSLLNRRRGRFEDFWALRDVTFDIRPGESFAIVGHNGSGKSTMLKCLTGILHPDEGRVSMNGKISALLELGAGFHPELSGRENVFLNAAILGVPRKEIDRRFDDIVAFSGLEQFIDTPVKNYSSGMFVRLGFAVAINVDPDILVIDEVLAVGDAEFQAKCVNTIGEFHEQGRTIILVTHAMENAAQICQRAAWLDHGTLRMTGRPDEVIGAYTDDALGPRGGRRLASGSGEFEIVSTALAARGATAPTLHTGDPLTVEVVMRATATVAAPRLTLSVHGMGGALLAQRHLDLLDGGTAEPGNEFRRTLEVDRMPLQCGRYRVTFTVTDPSSERALATKATDILEVAPGPVPTSGAIELPGTWR